MKRKRYFFIGCILVSIIVVPAILLSQTATPSQTDKFMRLKLEPAKKILEGIALEDYEMIAKNAQEVQTLTLDAKWNVLQTPQYVRNSDEFSRSVLLLRDAARNKNLDGATLAYMQMTLNCVKCHRDLRSQ